MDCTPKIKNGRLHIWFQTIICNYFLKNLKKHTNCTSKIKSVLCWNWIMFWLGNFVKLSFWVGNDWSTAIISRHRLLTQHWGDAPAKFSDTFSCPVATPRLNLNNLLLGPGWIKTVPVTERNSETIVFSVQVNQFSV